MEGPREGGDPVDDRARAGESGGKGGDAEHGISARRSIRERLGALRDYGPGSGSFDALLRGGGLRDRIGDGGDRLADRWRAIPELGRQRILAGSIVVAVAALIWFVLLPLGPCGFPGGDSCAPSDDTIGMIPADALAYAHLSLEPDDEQYELASGLAARAPGLSAAGLDLLASGPFDGADLDAVRGWAGDEAALVALPIGVEVQRAVLVSMADEAAARIFAAGMIGPNAESESVGGVTVRVAGKGGDRASAAAFFAGFAVLGEREAVGAIVSRWTEQGPSLSADVDASAAIADLPERRVAYAYLSPTGAQDLLSGPAEPLEVFVNPFATSGVAASLAVDGDRLVLAIRSELDPELSESSPGFFAALSPFEPTLTADVGRRALAYLGLGDPAAAVDGLLQQAEQSAPRLPKAFRRAARDLERETGVDVTGEILPLLGSQAALSVQPVGGAEEAPGVVGSAGAPYASLLATGVDSRRAATILAELQEPFAEAVSGGGPPQRFEPIQIAGLTAQSLPISPAIDLTYATWADRLAIATNPLGIEQARSDGDGLDSAPAFEATTSGMPEQVSLLAYVDATEVLRLAEQLGFATDLAYNAIAPELRALRAAALTVTAGGSTIVTDLTLLTSEP